MDFEALDGVADRLIERHDLRRKLISPNDRVDYSLIIPIVELMMKGYSPSDLRAIPLLVQPTNAELLILAGLARQPLNREVAMASDALITYIVRKVRGAKN